MKTEKKSQRPVMPEGFLERVAQRFKVLGEPARLKLVHTLMEGEKSVGGLVEETGLNQANASRHLHSLVQAGIVARRKEGNFVYYRVADATVFDLCESVCRSLRTRHEQESNLFQG